MISKIKSIAFYLSFYLLLRTSEAFLISLKRLRKAFISSSSNDLSDSLFLAECSMLCNTQDIDIIKKLTSKSRINLKATVRDVEKVAARYYVLDYEEILANNTSINKRILAVRGSTSIQNLQDSGDTAFEFDEFLGVNLHKGFRKVYSSILNDLPPYVFRNATKDGKPIEFSTTGHSLGGVISCLLGASLMKKVLFCFLKCRFTLTYISKILITSYLGM